MEAVIPIEAAHQTVVVVVSGVDLVEAPVGEVALKHLNSDYILQIHNQSRKAYRISVDRRSYWRCHSQIVRSWDDLNEA